MSRSERLRILSYDISENRRRRRVARLLEDHGTRVQFSVFEMRLSEAALRRVVRQASDELAPGDSLRVYTIGQVGERHCEVVGSGIPVDREAGFWLI